MFAEKVLNNVEIVCNRCAYLYYFCRIFILKSVFKRICKNWIAWMLAVGVSSRNTVDMMPSVFGLQKLQHIFEK